MKHLKRHLALLALFVCVFFSICIKMDVSAKMYMPEVKKVKSMSVQGDTITFTMKKKNLIFTTSSISNAERKYKVVKNKKKLKLKVASGCKSIYFSSTMRSIDVISKSRAIDAAGLKQLFLDSRKKGMSPNSYNKILLQTKGNKITAVYRITYY